MARIVGVLLAAGRGERFGGDKLRAALDGGDGVGVTACRALVAALPDTVAIVRPGDDGLAAELEAAGARSLACADAAHGMGHSIACAIGATPDAGGWVIALGDMPWIRRIDVRCGCAGAARRRTGGGRDVRRPARASGGLRGAAWRRIAVVAGRSRRARPRRGSAAQHDAVHGGGRRRRRASRRRLAAGPRAPCGHSVVTAADACACGVATAPQRAPDPACAARPSRPAEGAQTG